jgi:hypothetical protein
VTLPSRERLEELRDDRGKAWSVHCSWLADAVSDNEFRTLLDAAIALRRLETYMADPRLLESYAHVTRIAARVEWGDMAPSWYVEVEGTESPRQHGNGPDLLAALVAALEKAGAK